MADAATKTRVTSKTRLKEPKKFKVVVLNDDYTPMDFVIAMLITIFKHSEQTAITLTMKIHKEGSAVAGVYTYEIAEQRSIDATNLAREHGHPLMIKLEAE